MIKPYQLISESLMFNEKDAQWKFNDWISGKSNILFVLGFSGSGKSTTGKQLSQQYKCKHIDVDDDKKLHNSLPDWFELRKTMSMEEADQIYYAAGKKHMLSRFKEVKEPTIFEAIDFYIWFSSRELSEYPLVIKGTSYLISTIRGFKRDLKADWRLKNKVTWYSLLLDRSHLNGRLISAHHKLIKYLKK